MTAARQHLIRIAVLCTLAGCQPNVRPDATAAQPVGSANSTGGPGLIAPGAATGKSNAAPAGAAVGPDLSGSTASGTAGTAGTAATAGSLPSTASTDAPTALPGGTALTTGDQVFARIRSGLGSKSCAAGDNSEKWRRRYAANATAFANHLQQVLPLLDFVSIEVDRLGLPSEFVFIPLVESWYRPDAIGISGPAGMWQMIPSTARNHGIHIQPGYDGRLSPVESTRAALSYLKTLQDMFGNWEPVVMAYNAGEGRMMDAFRHAQTRDVSAARRKPHGLSNVTYDYVAKLQALSCLVAEPQRNGVTLPGSTRFVPLAPVLMDPAIVAVDQFASSRGADAAQLRRLNPGYKSGRIVAGVPRLILTPFGIPQADPSPTLAGNITPTAQALEALAAQTHKVHAGESLWSIAKLYSLSIAQLRRLNRLGRDAMVRPGQTLKLSP